MSSPLFEIWGCGDFQFEIGLQVQWQNQNQNQSPTIRLTILWSKDIWQGRQKECGVKRWVKKLPWKFFDSWNMGLRFPIWDWVAGAMTKCIVPAWLYCAPHVSGSYSCYIVYAFSAVTLFDNKFTLPASCKLKVGTMAQCGLKIWAVHKRRRNFFGRFWYLPPTCQNFDPDVVYWCPLYWKKGQKISDAI